MGHCGININFFYSIIFLDRIGIFPLFLAFFSLLIYLSLKWPHRNHVWFFNNSISISYFILKPKPYCPMKRKRKHIQCVISNRDLISSESAHSPSTARAWSSSWEVRFDRRKNWTTQKVSHNPGSCRDSWSQRTNR